MRHDKICFYCKYQYAYAYKPKMACMNEKGELYGEEIHCNDSCEKWEGWEDRSADDE